jgi:hypothetical protein
MIEELYNTQELLIQQSNQKIPKQFENLINKQIEKIKTQHKKINSYVGLKKIKNKQNVIWLKITNSYASIDDTDGNMTPHVLEGFYVSVLNEEDYFHLGFNQPVHNNLLIKIINYLNSVKEITFYDFLNYIQNIINRKADWLDKSF